MRTICYISTSTIVDVLKSALTQKIPSFDAYHSNPKDTSKHHPNVPLNAIAEVNQLRNWKTSRNQHEIVEYH